MNQIYDDLKSVIETTPSDELSDALLQYGRAQSLRFEEFFTPLIAYAFSRISELEKSLEQFRSDSYRDFEYHNER